MFLQSDHEDRNKIENCSLNLREVFILEFSRILSQNINKIGYCFCFLNLRELLKIKDLKLRRYIKQNKIKLLYKCSPIKTNQTWSQFNSVSTIKTNYKFSQCNNSFSTSSSSSMPQEIPLDCGSSFSLNFSSSSEN